MRAQHHRTQNHPGVIARRRPTPTASSVQRRPRRKSEKRGQGARVIWLMMILGSLVASGFLLAQRSQINTHQLRQAEETFKTQLDEMTNQQRYLALEKERATNAQESDRIAKQAGLVQPEFKRGNQAAVAQAYPAKSALSVMPAVKAPAPKQLAKSFVKPVAQPLTASAKKNAARMPVQSLPAAKRANVPPTGKANKDSRNQGQPAQKLTRKPGQKPPQKLVQISSPGSKEKRR